MLKLKYLFENYELAGHCAALYDFDAATLDEMLRHFRISSNAIYPFRAGSDPGSVRFLRLAPVAEKSFSRVASEIDLILWLRAAGIHAMEPVRMLDGKYADVVDTRWGAYSVSCFARVPGDALDDTEDAADIVEGYGRSLGELHRALKDYPSGDARGDWRGVACEIRSRLVGSASPAAMLRELDSVERGLSLLPVTRDNYGVIHFDYEPDNVFYDRETGVFSVIDFDDSVKCWFVLDVARAVDALDELVDAKDLRAASSRFVEGYRSVCPFSEEDFAALPLMRRFVRLCDYGTLAYVLSEPVAEEPEWLIALKQKLTSKMRRIESEVGC